MAPKDWQRHEGGLKATGQVLTNAITRLLTEPSQDGVGLYFYPGSSNDLTLPLLLPPGNLLGYHMITTDELLEERDSNEQSWLVTVLCDCSEGFNPDPTWFLNQPYPELWERFKTTVSVSQIERLRLPGHWYVGVAELSRLGQCSSHPFVFPHEDANSLVPRLNTGTRFAVPTMIRSSGFSGGPTGECSRTISRQLAELTHDRMPEFVVCDEPSRGHFEQSPAQGHYEIDNDRGLKGWGWGNVSVFVLRSRNKGISSWAGAKLPVS